MKLFKIFCLLILFSSNFSDSYSQALNTVNTTTVGISGGGVYNVLIGPSNNYSPSFSGDYNVAIGNESGKSLTTGSYNTFTGYLAGNRTTILNVNSFFGSYCGRYNTTGQGNSFFGSSAGTLNTSGNYNTFIGLGTGQNNTTGSSNTFIGFRAKGGGINGAALQRSTTLGYNATVSVDDGLVLGDTSSVKVGIGTAYPDQRLTIRGNMNFVAYDNSLRLKNQPFLHFNEHESLALGLGAEIVPGAEKTIVLGNKETTVQIPGIVNSYLPNAGQFLTVDNQGNVLLSQPRIQVASVADWSDKVFEPGYTLLPLDEVEDFVRKNKHLPGVPSAAEMVAEGMESAAFNAKLLEKIEELTLYVVELEKRLKELEKK